MKYFLPENNISCNVTNLSINYFVKSSKLKHEYYYLQDKYTILTFNQTRGTVMSSSTPVASTSLDGGSQH